MKDVLTKLDELKRLADAATPGPWAAVHGPKQSRYSYVTSDFGTLLQRDGHAGRQEALGSGGDAAFIAASRTGWPATVEALRVAVEALRDCWHENNPEDVEMRVCNSLARISEILEVKP